jgi:hypothetical protein
MTDDAIDSIFSADETIVPSPAFVSSVMQAVRREAAPAPIPFPWGRALPGLLAFAVAVVWCLVLFAQRAAPIPASPTTVAIAECVALVQLLAALLSFVALRMQGSKV